MTFLEAAIEILRRADGAMHFSEIAKRAVDENLLSHVGRDPEAAMRTCLTSAVRESDGGEPALVVRKKPGYYTLREGAELPPSPELPAARRSAKPAVEDREMAAIDPASERKKSRRRGRGRKDEPAAADGSDEDESSADATPPDAEGSPRDARGRRRGVGRRGPSQAGESKSAPPPGRPAKAIEFEAPSGSGLEGVTDVALVMANAMSRLVEERPELRGELEAMQQPAQGATQAQAQSQPERTPNRSNRASNRDRGEDRPSNRRRRRRRRRGKRVEWSAGSDDSGRAAADMTEKLLEAVETVLADAGARSLHVRQIAENVANKGLLGGEISEIERAITSAILMDVHAFGRGSRFVARGDARYQLHGTRMPEPVAKAERAVRHAVRTLERETFDQLERWLQSLGARALESLVRIYMQTEGWNLVAAMPPARGIGKLVVEDPEGDDDTRTLVLVIPRRTGFDPKLWEGELERNECTSLLAVSMADVPDETELGETRVIQAAELAEWLRDHRIGVQRSEWAATVLDPDFIESIAGLDT